jgi:hypothetical protein
MRTKSRSPSPAALVICLLGALSAPVAVAQAADSHDAPPARGTRMTAVEAALGAPSERHAAVGNPPITRWDYPGFVVFFENDRVIHAVRLSPAS